MTDRQYRTPRVVTRADTIRRACAIRGIEIIELASGAFRLYGGGTDMLVATLRDVDPRDLAPVRKDVA